MASVQVPLVDNENPLYCPHLSASAYLTTLRQSLQHHSMLALSDIDLSLSAFFRKLTGISAPKEAPQHPGNYGSVCGWVPGMSSPSTEPTITYGRNQVSDDLPEAPVARRGFAGLAWRRLPLKPGTDKRPRPQEDDPRPFGGILSSLDGSGPARKRARYTNSANKFNPSSLAISSSEWRQLSYDLRGYREPSSGLPFQGQQTYMLNEASEEARTPVLGNLPFLPPSPGNNNDGRVYTRTFLLRLEEAFPGLGFRQAAESFDAVQESINDLLTHHQALVDLLGERGFLNENALIALQGAEFHQLDLGPTMHDENGLNLPRGNLMQVFSRQGWFKNLDTLSFAGGRFRDDFDLVHIQSLRQIQKLVLASTGIGNEGVFHIVSLKHKLLHLDLSKNPKIDDDAIPALILFENLHYLSIFDTGVLMPGLRRLAVDIQEDGRIIDIEIPSMCEAYIDNLNKQYLLHPAPPLITDPAVCSVLGKAALSRNLAAHAATNSSIHLLGTRKEMAERLKKILEMRKLDLIVQSMLAGEDTEDV
ncbi:hypothetical protein PAXRUDRAFT_9828 [Paxillus rubicundulus Ve08.2h10]|uniref:Uncharacterized protein n=1 Tax=Paxillus rubicundulus Ve08.2h10 TaxID=930991 RepID=A0A0D0E7W8_9AGAM|nr:hypothetical protein PAXRUDRAFT_9828 [Paxillus rubicundulus Ve08.2h10]